MTQVLARSRRDIAVVFILVSSVLLSGLWADQARAAAATGREQMLALTNEDRTDKGKSDLGLDAKLSRYAKKHSREMAQEGYLFHTDDLAAELKGVEWRVGGENVGVGSSLTSLEQAFMSSKPHRKNILRGGFDHAAIGIVRSDGKLWVTVIFYG